MPRTLTETTERLLGFIPPYYAEAVDAQGTMLAAANEIDFIDSKLDGLVGNNSGVPGEFFPLHTDLLLGEWESVLGISSNVSRTNEQRLTSIRAVLRTLKSADSADSWKNTFDQLVGVGLWSYLVNGAAATITLYLPYGVPMSSPLAFTFTVSGTGGTIPTATYFYAVTASNVYGETELLGGTSNAITLGQNANIGWTAPAVGSRDEYFVYRGSSASNMRRLVTSTPITATSFVDTGAFALGGSLAPTTSSTTPPAAAEAVNVARAITPAHINLSIGYTAGFIIGVSKVGDLL